MRKLLRIICLWILLILLVVIGGYIFVHTQVEMVANGHIYSSVDSLPTESTRMILGAQVFPDLVPSPALAYRLQTGVELYKEGKVKKLLLSGDGRSPYYDEVATMQEYLLKAHIPASDIVVDKAGLRTYDSCYRAENEYKLKQLLIITQPDHLLRAVFTCRSLGIDAVGYAAPDINPGSWWDADYWRYFAREKGALILAWFDVEVVHPTP